MTLDQPSPANNAAPEVSRVNDFDQTVKHDHRPGIVCPAGWPTPKAYSMGNLIPPHVSPSILEFRIKELENDLEDEKRKRKAVDVDLKTAQMHLDARETSIYKLIESKAELGEIIADLKFAVASRDEHITTLEQWAARASTTLHLAGSVLPEDAQDVDQLEAELELRDKRIEQLEGLVTSLAKHIDIIDAETIFITGNSLAEHAEKAVERDAA